MASRWIYLSGRDEHGPFTVDELIELAKSRKINAQTSVRREGESKHYRAAQLKRLRGILLSPETHIDEHSELPNPLPSTEEPSTVTLLTDCASCGHTLRSSQSSKGTKRNCTKCGKPVSVLGERTCNHLVFISHSSKDGEIANNVCSALERMRIPCWIAPRNLGAGQQWGKEIVDAISGSRILLLIHSKEANRSPQVLREVERAVSKSVAIVPYKIDDCTLSKDFEFFLGATHWLDVSDVSPKEGMASLTPMIQALLDDRIQTPVAVSKLRKRRQWLGKLSTIAVSLLAFGLGLAMPYWLRGPSQDEGGVELVKLISETIAPESWEYYGGYGTIRYLDKSLTVSQTSQAHEDIAKCLNEIRKSRGLPTVALLFPNRPQAVAKWFDEVDKMTALEFIEEPLYSAVDYIRDVHAIPIYIDERSLDNIGQDASISVNLRATDVPLRVAFEMLLEDHDLAYIIREEGIVITTLERAEFESETVVYNVSDLLDNYRSYRLPYEPSADSILEQWRPDKPASGPGGFGGGGFGGGDIGGGGYF